MLTVVLGVALLGALGWGGATHADALRVLMPLASLALVAAWLARARLGSPRISAPVVVLAALGVASACELPITSDAGATWLVVGRLAALVAIGIALSTLARDPRRPLHVLLVAMLVAVVALAALAGLGITLPSPLVAPEATRAWVRSPFQNPSHLGALVASLLPIVWVLYERAFGVRRVGYVVLLIAANVVLVGTRSRGALLGGALAQIAVHAWRLRRLRAVVIGAPALAAFVVEMLARGGVDPSSPMSRVTAWRDALALLRDHPLAGVGPGAFGCVFPRYSSVAGRVHHAFVENQYLQVVLDLGLPVGLALLGALVWVALRTRIDGAHSMVRAAAIGLTVLALHEATDFATWGGAIALVGLALVAIATEGQGRKLEGATLAIAVLPLAGLWGSLEHRTADEDRARFEAALDGLDARRVDALANEIFARHPNDPEVPLLAAEKLAGDPASVRWVELGLRLAPRDPRAHANAAWALARAGFASQAAAELRTGALAAGDRDRGRIEEAALRTFAHDPKLLAAALPADDTRTIVDVAHRLPPEIAKSFLDAIDARPLDLVRARIEIGLALHEATLRPLLDELGPTDADRLLALRVASQLGDHERADAIARGLLSSNDEAMRVAAVLSLRGERGLVEQELARAVWPASKASLLDRLASIDDAEGHVARAELERAEAKRLR